MKPTNLFAKTFFGITALTIAFLFLTSYAGKKAIAADPELLNRLQSKYNIRINGFGITPSQEITKDRWSFSEPLGKVVIATIEGEMRLTPAEGNELSIEAEGRLPKETEKDQRLLKVQNDNGILKIAESRGVSDLTLIIKIPKNIPSLSLGTVSGDISMKNVLAKEFIFNSISGDLIAENVRFPQTVAVTVSGDVQIENLEPGSLTVESVSGDITLKLAPEQKSIFTLKSLSGEIKNSLPSVEGSTPVVVKTTSGDIEIQ